MATSKAETEQTIYRYGGELAVMHLDEANSQSGVLSARAGRNWTGTWTPWNSPPPALPGFAHAAAAVGYTRTTVEVVMWGSPQAVSWSWWATYVYQGWALSVWHG